MPWPKDDQDVVSRLLQSWSFCTPHPKKITARPPLTHALCILVALHYVHSIYELREIISVLSNPLKCFRSITMIYQNIFEIRIQKKISLKKWCDEFLCNERRIQLKLSIFAVNFAHWKSLLFLHELNISNTKQQFKSNF